MSANEDVTVGLGGGFQVTVVRAGSRLADAGTVFGPVPWVMWNGLVVDEIDADWQIPLASNSLLVETPGGVALVDAGPDIVAALEAIGTSPRDIDVVILTSLQRDHAGGLVDQAGRLAFPNARIVAQSAEWAIALTEHARLETRYDRAALARLRGHAADRVDGDAEVLPGVSVRATGGISMGHQVVVIEGADRTCAAFGDLLMRPWAANPRWVSSFDDRPLDSVARKATLFAEAADGGWSLIASRAVTAPIGRLIRDRDRFRWEGPDR